MISLRNLVNSFMFNRNQLGGVKTSFKRFIAGTQLVLMVFGGLLGQLAVSTPVHAAFDGGDGTPLTPWQISTCLQLQDMTSRCQCCHR